MKTVDAPPLALILAAEAIGDLPALSSPEDMARAALDVAWSLVLPPNRAAPREEIALVRELVARNYTWGEIASLLGCTVGRVETVTRSAGIRAGVRGKRGEERRPHGLDGLTKVVREARQS